VALVGNRGPENRFSALSILKLLPYPTASHPSGKHSLQGRELLELSEREIAAFAATTSRIIFQEPMTSLNPLHTIESRSVKSCASQRNSWGHGAGAGRLSS